MKINILRFDEIDSTNTEALNQARRGADEGLCVIARCQTAGRGRLGRTWVSGEDAGLFFSIVLRPKIETRFLPLITLMSAVAVHDTLESLYAVDCDIKWVNDIHVNGRKICGILAETTETKKGTAVVVGIGINLKSSNFPSEVASIATSVEQETKHNPNKETLVQRLTFHLSSFYTLLARENGPAAIRDEWTARSTYAIGKDVRVMLENESFEGKTCGIGENGALSVKLKNGEIRVVSAGDVEQLRSV